MDRYPWENGSTGVCGCKEEEEAVPARLGCGLNREMAVYVQKCAA